MARPRYELWAETIRELGVLILVFVPLDTLVEYFRGGQFPDLRHLLIILGIAGLGLLLIVFGVEMERR